MGKHWNDLESSQGELMWVVWGWAHHTLTVRVSLVMVGFSDWTGLCSFSSKNPVP